MSAPAPEPCVSAGAAVLDELRGAVGRFFSDPAARADAGVLYGRLASEAPVLQLGPMWLVSGFDELSWLSGRPELRSFPAVGGQIMPVTCIPSLARWAALMFPVRDGEDHRRLRGLAAQTFGPRRIAQVGPLIAACVDEVLEPAIERGEMEVVSDLAAPLPIAVSAAILDIPEADHALVKKWALLTLKHLLRFDQTQEEVSEVEHELGEFARYVGELCERRLREPGDDLISDLAQAAACGQLSHDELVAFVLMLFVNGLETLTAGLTMAVWEFLRHPQEHSLVGQDLAFAEAMFDEAVRLHAPVRFSARTLAADVELAGHHLSEGDVVALCYGAANRDPRRFPAAERFDPRRARERHLGYGHGVHRCIGAALAQSSGACVLRRLATCGKSLATDVRLETMAWSPAIPFTTLDTLPMRFGRLAAVGG